MLEKNEHPGQYIKRAVIPAKMTVAKAARLIGVGRPALSNLLNGKSDLSPQMATRLEKAFNLESGCLLRRQDAYKANVHSKLGNSVIVRPYAPSFLNITASQIESWANTHRARGLLAVLLRRLIHSTGKNIIKCDFPGHDNSQRRGWDGYLETDTATPWIPLGRSVWEFGCSNNPKQKAEKDFTKRKTDVDPVDRKNITFVFVTPRNWPQKEAWVKEKRLNSGWKDVIVRDANEFEQWLERSSSTQIWFSEQLGILTEGLSSLEQCWQNWTAVTDPELSELLFDGAVEAHKNNFIKWLENPTPNPFRIISSSREESLAYLYCLFNAVECKYKDKVIVINSPAALLRVRQTIENFIPVLVGSEVENESVGIHKKLHTIVISDQIIPQLKADIALGIIDANSFKSGLSAMGFDQEKINVLARQSGRSLTILRKQLTSLPGKLPAWTQDSGLVNTLIAIGFIGVWDSLSKEDTKILHSFIESDIKINEEKILKLLNAESSPICTNRRFYGVTSKWYVLNTTSQSVTKYHLDKFFEVAYDVLSKKNAVISEEKQYRVGSTHCSSELRASISETLILLAIHGNELYGKRLYFCLKDRVDDFIRNLLMPLDVEKLILHSDHLPYYAEAAPDTFLDILEEDLKSENSKILLLMKANSNAFGMAPPRVGLLWALELLAWKPERLLQVAKILAKLSETRIDDNLTNKPENSLKALFFCLMPQTRATIDERCKVLEKLKSLFPNVVWRLCISQFFNSGFPVWINHNYRPRWRDDACGAGQTISSDSGEFAKFVLDMVVDSNKHDENTLSDLIQCLKKLNKIDQERVFQKIKMWIKTNPSDEQKKILREKIRSIFFKRFAGRDKNVMAVTDSVREIFNLLVISDPVVRHQWLFSQHWPDDFWEMEEKEEFDYQKREDMISKMRRDAIDEIWNEVGMAGIIKLSLNVTSTYIIGNELAKTELPEFNQMDFVKNLIEDQALDMASADNFLSGYLLQIPKDTRHKLLLSLIKHYKDNDDVIIRILKCAPCSSSVWQIVDTLSSNSQERYWFTVSLNWSTSIDENELQELVQKLLYIGRPKTAFAVCLYRFEKLDSQTLVQLLKQFGTNRAEVDTNFNFQSYDLVKAFKVLENRTDVLEGELAQLEFMYLHDFGFVKEHGIPHLEQKICEDPSLFAQAVGFAYNRKNDDGKDRLELQISDPDNKKNMAHQAFCLLDNARRIPGTEDNGKIDLEKLRTWILEVRRLCKEYDREDMGDASIGELLSKSKLGEDGIWPDLVVRDMLEDIGNPTIMEYIVMGLYNQRGVHFRAIGVGGAPERSLAAMYRDWSKKTAFDWPFTSRLFEKLAQAYDSNAKFHDTRI